MTEDYIDPTVFATKAWKRGMIINLCGFKSNFGPSSFLSAQENKHCLDQIDLKFEVVNVQLTEQSPLNHISLGCRCI